MRYAKSLPIVAVLLIWLAAFACPAASGQETAARIHLLVVADTNDPSIGESVKADLKAVPEVFRGNVPDWQLHVETISGLWVRPERIVATIQRMNIQPARDTIVFYYSGHGGYDQQAREHVLYPHRRPLAMRAVKAALEQARPRLAVALTDTCSTFVSGPMAAPIYPPPTRISASFKSLFLDPTGFVFVSSTKPGQEARGGPGGGFFTFTFLEYVHTNHDRALSWSNVVANVNDAIETRYAGMTRQTAYLAAAGSRGNPAGSLANTLDNNSLVAPLATPSDSPSAPPTDTPASPSGEPAAPPAAQSRSIRFGVTAEQTPRSASLGGVEVALVIPTYPGTQLRGRDGKEYYLVAGRDVITHVNGQHVTTYAEFSQAIDHSPDNMMIRVCDMQTRTTNDYTVDLSVSRRRGKLRFGVTAEQTARGARAGGLEVTLVIPTYPGTQLRGSDGKQYFLVAGRDVITHINGQSVTTYGEFSTAVNASPANMTIRVYDMQTGTTADYEVTLRE